MQAMDIYRRGLMCTDTRLNAETMTTPWLHVPSPDISKAFLMLSPSSIREISIPDSGILPLGWEAHGQTGSIPFFRQIASG